MLYRINTIRGFSHILVDNEGAPIGVAKHLEERHDIEFGVVLLFSWPAERSPDYRMTGGYNRIEVSDASSSILDEVRLLLCHYPVLV